VLSDSPLRHRWQTLESFFTPMVSSRVEARHRRLHQFMLLPVAYRHGTIHPGRPSRMDQGRKRAKIVQDALARNTARP
jgi:hypothetical protein